MPLDDKIADVIEGSDEDCLPNELVLAWSRDIAEGVWHLHRYGAVHRDIKLDNIMWDSQGGPEGVGRAVLIDFGCAYQVTGKQHGLSEPELDASMSQSMDEITKKRLSRDQDHVRGN